MKEDKDDILPIILLVEDNDLVGKSILDSLNGLATILWETTLDGAINTLVLNQGIKLIILDACLKSPITNTLSIIQIAREIDLQCPIIANSTDFNEELIAAGATNSSKVKAGNDLKNLVICLLNS